MLYYQLYGPSIYYPLLSQGTLGQGEKETYVAAAMALNMSFYQIHTPPDTITYEQDHRRGGH